jgi:hypothetical protein
MTTKFFSALSLEQVKHIRSGSISSHLNDNLVLILSNQFVLISTEHLEQFQVNCFFDVAQTDLLSGIIDCPNELGHIQSQELFVVLENFIKQQSSYPVLINVSHEDVNVIVHLQLILEIITNVGNQKPVTTSDELCVVLVVIGDTVDTLLDNR